MKKIKLIMRPTKTRDIDFDELYDQISEAWENKAHNLRSRRWRKLQDELF